MSLATTVRAMAAASCSAEQIAAVVEAHEAAAMKAVVERRAKDAERKRKSRASEMSRGQPVTDADGADKSSPEVSPQRDINQTPLPNPSKSSLRSDSASKILREVLSDETADELTAHRKAKRSPLTVGAAKGLVKAFKDFGNPEEAAREMMARGWTGFKPEWMAERQARAGPAAFQRPRVTSLSTLAFGDLDAAKPSDFDNLARIAGPAAIAGNLGPDFLPLERHDPERGREALGNPGGEIIPPRRAAGA